MGNKPTSNSKSSDTSNNNNVSKLNALAEQLQLKDQIGDRRRFCDDVLLDTLHFLRRNEHAQVRLASRRLQWLSNITCARYPPRVMPWLDVHGVFASPIANVVPRTEATGPQIVANSMRLVSLSGASHLADFPLVEPPEDIVHLANLHIEDFVGPELLRFLHVSARLLGKCRMVFTNFDNFVRCHSTDFILRFFGLFPSANRTIELHHVSSRAAPLFRDHPAMFDCIDLRVDCLDTFPLDALQGWLHLDEQKPPKHQKDRYLIIQIFTNVVKVDHSIDSVRRLVQQIKQRFLSATSCCPFTVLVGLWGGVLPGLDQFVEDNQRTGEQLEFRRLELDRGFTK